MASKRWLSGHIQAYRDAASNFRAVWRQFFSIAKLYWVSDKKVPALSMLGALILLLAAVNGLNVVINYVAGAFQTALAGRDQPTFWHEFAIYFGVFVVGTPIVVLYQWFQDKLGMRWREWLTRHLLDKYFENRAYYHINNDSHIDNPDERLAADIAAFTKSALSWLLVILGSIITLASFLKILWGISHELMFIVLGSSVVVTMLTVFIGKRLIGLNFNQLRREADFRYSLIHVRNNVESIAFYRGEKQENATVKERFKYAITNFNVLIGWTRNLGFVQQGYNYLTVLIPSLVIAPLYFAKLVEFGTISQADMAFGQILGALSLVIASFNDLSNFIAQIKRLGQFYDAINRPAPAATAERPVITTKESDQILLEGVSVMTPNYQETLVKDVNLALASRQGLLIVGPSGSGKSSLLRAFGELWNSGTGTITHPALEQMMFLPQRPYMILGSLRSQMLYPNVERQVPDSELAQVLAEVNLADLPQRVAKEGGFDAVLSWSDVLSLGEQQRLAFARVLLAERPYVILDEATSALDVKNEERLYARLKGMGVTYMSVGHRPTLVKYHDYVLELCGCGDASWQLYTAAQYKEKLEKESREALS